jgi:hypothetical protein
MADKRRIGDYLLAHKLLSETIHTLPMCDPNPETDIGTNRMLILFTGIAPYRGVVCHPHSPPLIIYLSSPSETRRANFLSLNGSGPNPAVQAAAH